MNARQWETTQLVSKENEKDSETVRKVGDVLRSPPATGVIRELKNSTKSFSQLKKNLSMSSGSLNYHLLKLRSAGILKKTQGERYTLTTLGQKVSEIVRRTLKEVKGPP